MPKTFKNSTLLLLFFLLICSSGKSQNNPLADSLQKNVDEAVTPQQKVDALCALAFEYKTIDIKKANRYADQAFVLAKENNYTHGFISALNMLADLDHSRGNYADALTKLKEALEFAQKENDNKAMALCFLNIGDVYSTLHSFDKAISNYEKCNTLSQQEKNNQVAIIALNRIGNRNMDKGNASNDTTFIAKAISIYGQAQKLSEKINDLRKVINSYVNLADAYIILGKKTHNKNYYFWSIDYALRAIKIARDHHETKAESIALLNIGEAYENLGEINKAIHYYELALDKYTALRDRSWIMNIHKSLANAYLKLNNYTKSIEHVTDGIKLAKQEELKVYLRDYYEILTKIYFQKNDFKNAFETNQLYVNYKDSILNENSSINIARLQTELELDKKDLEIELLNKNADIAAEKIRAQTIQRNYLIAGIIVIFILLLFIYYRYREKNRIQEQIIRAKEIAEHAKETQEQFLANTSHEIRTPMNGIIGMTNHLKDTPLTNEQSEYISAINESANSLLVLINDLLDLSKINAGKMTFEKRAFKISDLFKNLIYSLQYRSTEKNIRLVSSIDEKIPSILLGDAVRLNQILLNLTGNAIKFTEVGEVKLAAHLVKDDGKNVWILFSVQDTGIGIEENKLDTIFESFAQVNAKRTRKYGGTGLGLTIAKQLIEQQGGTISVSSKVNEGSTFSFTLTFAKAIRVIKGGKENPTAISDFSRPNLHALSILVVDDNKVNQRVAALTLQKWNAKVDVADHAKMCFEKLQSKHFDLILMDVTMPEIDGFEATQYIRKKMPSSISKIPIIAMTASAFTGDREKCIAMGMNEYISKPFNPEELYDKIVKIVSIEKHSSVSPIVDLSLLHERAEGDVDYLKDIIETYIQEMPLYVREMQQYAKESNMVAIASQAHKMKSPAKLLGAFTLNQKLELLEKLPADTKLTNAVLEQITEMTELCLQTVEALKEELKKIG